MIKLQKEQIRQIASELDCGIRHFCNKKTGKIINIVDMDDYLIEGEENPWKNELHEIEENEDDYFEFENMSSRESFALMEDFINLLDNITLREKLMYLIKNKKPFKNFKLEIDNSGEYRQKWFDFKEQKYIEWVEKQITQFNKQNKNE